MNIKLHNKYEISVGNKTYVAFNTITNKIFEAIKNFTQYSSVFAIGSGANNSGYDNPYLDNVECLVETQLEELQCDPSKGVMYAKRYGVIPAGTTGFYLSEIGITDSVTNTTNPVVYSHAYIKDENGEIAQIYKEVDQELHVRVTLYLEISPETATYLTAGENLLVKAVLGELDHIPAVTVARGYNNAANNVFVHRNMPRESEKFNAAMSLEESDGAVKFNFTADIKSGSTAEIVLMFDNSPVARVNTVGAGVIEDIELELESQSNYILNLYNHISTIQSVVDVDGAPITGYVEKNYAQDFGDFIANPFEETFNAECARWVSKDGKGIAFVSANSVYIYINNNYSLHKVFNNISAINLQEIIMFEDFVFAIYQDQPHFKVYKIEGSQTVEITTDMQVYEQAFSDYDWQEVQIISADNINFTIGVVFGVIARRPIVMHATLENGVFTITEAAYGACDYIVHSFSLYKNSFCNSMIGFITNNYNGNAEHYRIEQWYPDKTSEITNEVAGYYLCQGTVKLEGKSRAVIAKRTTSPYIWLYYFPQVYRYSISLTAGVENWISTNLLYIIQKYNNAEQPYKIYSLSEYNNPIEFTNGFPENIDQSTITDFEFVGDTLIIFTTSGTYALNLKETCKVLENMPEAEATYTISGSKETLMGTAKSEGIVATFSLEFTVWNLQQN